MALAADRGVRLLPFEGEARHAQAFGEDQGRYLVGLRRGQLAEAQRRAAEAGVPFMIAAETVEGKLFEIPSEPPIPLATLREAHESWLPKLMG
jgi:phosphoribosylformylglycinamidine synthase